MDGKSLIIGWKGTPIHCLSVWKFAWQEIKGVRDVNFLHSSHVNAYQRSFTMNF
jgi:hypothetical protein